VTDRSEWVRCRSLTIYEFEQTGGYEWRALQKDHGNTLRIPAGNRFKVRLEGPQSNVLRDGYVNNGKLYFKGPNGDLEFDSPNQLVAHVRKDYAVASNAYLYFMFEIDREWHEAQDLRLDPEISVDLLQDRIEAEALRIAEIIFRDKLAKKEMHWSDSEIRAKAKKIANNNREIYANAKESVISRDKLLSDLIPPHKHPT